MEVDELDELEELELVEVLVDEELDEELELEPGSVPDVSTCIL